MFPKPKQDLKINTYNYESMPLVSMNGFREYDARWLFGDEINLMGIQALGLGLGTLIHRLGVEPTIITGHDFRSYSSSIKLALSNGLVAAGCHVKDIGLAVSPMAYFSQFALDVPCVAMVTASHNENGWTGVKMGVDRPLTFGPDEMSKLKEIVLNGDFEERDGGRYEYIKGVDKLYIDDLTSRPPFKRKIKAVIACGNGTAGAFGPQVFEKLGVDVIPLDCDLDYTFPNYNPNTEDMKMLHAMRDKVLETGADLAIAFDGDGDRCGIVDNKGREIFADKVGVMIAQDISAQYDDAQFVVDVKSTGLYLTDPTLKSQKAKVEYWKTGHSYMKRRTVELGAIAGFEKSGHYFFNPPIGRGYDDGIVSALAVCDMLDRSNDKSMSDLYDELPTTWGSPTMSPHCDDDKKYGIIDKITAILKDKADKEELFSGQKIIELVTVNGVRATVEDGTWALIRASSNKPELVVVVESPQSEARMHEIFAALNEIVDQFDEIGDYNQTI